MDSIFGIGLPEFVVIVVIAGMVMGPERIAQAARVLGRMTARLQDFSRAFFRQLNAELDAVDESGDLKATVEELQQLRRQVAELRGEIFTLASGTAADTRQVVRDVKREAQVSIMPPDLLARSPKAVAPSDGNPVYRPPSLFDNDVPPAPVSSVNGSLPVTSPVQLPKRVNVADDPDE